jgi:hypothetical protein
VDGSSGLIVLTHFILDQIGYMQYDPSLCCRTKKEELRQYYAHDNSEGDTLNFTGSPIENAHSLTDSITPASNFTTLLPFLSENQTLEFDEAELPELLDTHTAIYVYTALILGSVFITSIRSMFFFKVCMTASKILHDTMFGCILAATMRFFDTNPSGKHCIE